jgi:hypothetical protein
MLAAQNWGDFPAARTSRTADDSARASATWTTFATRLIAFVSRIGLLHPHADRSIRDADYTRGRFTVVARDNQVEQTTDFLWLRLKECQFASVVPVLGLTTMFMKGGQRFGQTQGA